MDCPNCQTNNPETRKFCRECGNKLPLVCPQCSFENIPGDKFCGECGHNLTVPSEPTPKDLSFDEKLEKIQKYLPGGLTDKILAQKGKIEGERKQVTVMFCDMEGFTPLVEKLGAEDAYGIMDQIYEILIHKVHDYEGTVNEMTGDGIMALFGAPIALEDAPQRAIRSALAIHREMARFSDRIKEKKEGIPPIKMRVGIHTGPVVVGTLGNDLRVEFKAVGETVNLASRMEGLAEPGSAFITENTFKLTEGFFRFEALGEKIIKGKKEPVKVYRVIAPSSRRTRFDVSAERGLTPFVGRERELELLLDGFERTKGGRGQAFSIVSEAGVGKSRLLYEFRKAVANEDVTFLEGKCLSYSRGVAYHPIIDILKSNFNIRDGDFEIKEKVTRGLKVLGADEASTLPYLLELLSVKDSGINKVPLSPEGRKDRIIEALRRIVLNGSEIRPLIMAIEDLHWIDKSSEDSLKDLLDSITGARVFLIFTYRPEFVHTWGGRSYHGQVNLNRLFNQESLTIVSHLLATEEIHRDLEELILEKTEGVPFFIEEFIRSLKDLKIIERQDNKYFLARDIKDLNIPSTLQDVIMARVDTLSEGAKEVLQTGSVIEREFSYELIKHVSGLPEKELLSHLSALIDSELLYERGIYPKSTYIFKHALTREVVYHSILTRKQKRLHEETGNAIEKLYKDSIDEHYGILAEHFIESENYEKGAEYSKFAGKILQRKIIDIRTVLSGYYLSLNYHIQAKEAVSPVVDLAQKLNYQKRNPAIYTAIGSHGVCVEEDFSEGPRYLREAIKASEEVGDFFSLWFASYFLGSYLSWNCEFEEGLYYLEKSLELSLAANNLVGIVFAESTISSCNYILHGKIEHAFISSKESLQRANESGDIYVRGMAYASHGMCCYYKGSFDEALSNLLQGLDLCEKSTHNIWGGWASLHLGETYFVSGEYEKAVEYYKKMVELFLEADRFGPPWIRLAKVFMIRSKVLNNDHDIRLEDLGENHKEIRLKGVEGWMARLFGEILLNINDQHISEAEDWIKKAIQADSKNGMVWHLGRDYALYAELFKRKSDLSKAREKLGKAIEIFKECGADGWVEKYEKELVAL